MPGTSKDGPRFRRDARDTVDSTNALALQQARAGEAGPLWVTAERQDAGRGRHGRAWVSEPGNLYASLLLTNPAPARHLPELPLLAAVALAHAIEDAGAIREPVGLKWPNDLLIGGRKLSGILLEATDVNAATAVVIGIGVNVQHHPDRSDYPTTSLAALGGTTDPEIIFAALDRAVADQLELWDRGTNFAEIRRQWLARAVGLGTMMTIRMPDEVFEARFVDLDEAGRLLVRQRNGVMRTISAGDVFFPGHFEPGEMPAHEEGR